VPVKYIEGQRTILVRCEAGQFDDAVDMLGRLSIGSFRVARLVQEAGEPHRLIEHAPRNAGETRKQSRSRTFWRRAAADASDAREVDWADVDEILVRARAAEVRALLLWSDAVWHPTNFHFELSSGLHSDVFVRVADAVTTPRDAHVIATWLTPELADQVGIVTDTGTMTAVIAAAQTLVERKGWRLGPTSILDQYPRTALDAIAAVMHANVANRVIGFISVSSSGRLRDRLWSALQTQSDVLERASLHILLDTTQPSPIAGIEQWLPLPGEEPFVRPSVQAGRCVHCREPARAPIARIVGPTFRPLLPSDEILLMPDPTDARRNRRFWEICDDADAIGVEEPPSPGPQIFRQPRKRMNIRIRFERLVTNQKFLDTMAEQARAQHPSAVHDLVLVPQSEREIDGFDGVWEAIAPVVATCTAPTVYPIDREWTDPSIVDAVRSANRILIFGLGSVTGSTLQRGMTGVQHLRDDWQYHTSGLVVHARPATLREWETLSNSFSGQLNALWLTFIPDWSPLVDEANALEDLDPASLQPEAAKLLEDRKKLCSGALSVDEVPLLLGTALTDRVTPHSLFGHRIGAAALYAAAASALASRLTSVSREARSRNARFEMPALVRSYYDPLILCSMLRWLRPHEIYWGEDPQASDRVIRELLVRAEHTDTRWEVVLLSELGVAVALGKVPRPGAEFVHARAKTLMTSIQPEASAALELATALIERTHSF
jgi:hypothetical protein